MKSFKQSLSIDNGKVVNFRNGNKTITAPSNEYFNIRGWNVRLSAKTISVGCQNFNIQTAKSIAKQFSQPISKKLYTNGGRTYCNATIVSETPDCFISSSGKNFPKHRYMVKQTYNISIPGIRINNNNTVCINGYDTDLTPEQFGVIVGVIVDCHKYLYL